MQGDRRDWVSSVKSFERGVRKIGMMMGIVSSVSNDGKIINAQSYLDGEVRELKVALPYGISSSAVDGLQVQVIVNDNDACVATGVVDKNRPSVLPGELMLYNKSGASIHLKANGDIVMKPGSGGKIYIG